MGKAKQEIVIPEGRLYPNMPSGVATKIPIFGVAGPIGCGKTLMGLHLAPGVHPIGHAFAGKPRLACFDFEMSNTYTGTGCELIDVPAELGLEKGDEVQYGSIDVFLWVCNRVKKIQAGQYDVIMFDTMGAFDTGLTAYIEKKPTDFDISPEQVRAMKGLFWGVMKKELERRLLAIAAKCETFFFTNHLKPVWKGDKPVPNSFQAEGKNILMRIASLYLRLERKPGENGKLPKYPSALTSEPWGKERLSDTYLDDRGKLVVTPLLPARMPVATIDVLHAYITSPPDLEKPKKGESVPEALPLTEDEKTQLALETAMAQRDTEGSRLAQLDRQVELRTLAQQQPQGPVAQPSAPQTVQQQAVARAEEVAKEKAEAKEAAELDAKANAALAASDAKGKALMAKNDACPNVGTGDIQTATEEQRQRVASLCGELSMSFSQLQSTFLIPVLKVEKIVDATADQCDSLILTLEREIGKRAKNSQAGPENSTN